MYLNAKALGSVPGIAKLKNKRTEEGAEPPVLACVPCSLVSVTRVRQRVVHQAPGLLGCGTDSGHPGVPVVLGHLLETAVFWLWQSPELACRVSSQQ